MHLLTLPDEIKMQIYGHTISAFQSRAEQWPGLSWTFAFYIDPNSEYFADIPLLSACRQTRQELCESLAPSSPLQILRRDRLKDTWEQSFPSLAAALPIALDYAAHVKRVEIYGERLDPSGLDVLPELFPRLKSILHHRKGERRDHHGIRKLLPDWDLNAICPAISLSKLRGHQLFGCLALESKLSHAELEASEVGRMLEEHAVSRFIGVDQRGFFLGDLRSRTFGLEVVYDFEFKLQGTVPILHVHVLQRTPGVYTASINLTKRFCDIVGDPEKWRYWSG